MDAGAVSEVAAAASVPGRLELVAEDPPTILDGAHNPDGAAALAEALPEVSGGRPVFACIAILADKDAEAILGALAPVLEHVVCTEVAEPLGERRAARCPARRRPPSWRRSASGSVLPAERVPDPGRRWPGQATCSWARRGGAGCRFPLPSRGAWTRRHAQSSSR